MTQKLTIAFCDKLHPEHAAVITLDGKTIKGERHQPPETMEIGLFWARHAPTNAQLAALAIQLRLARVQFGLNLRVELPDYLSSLREMVRREAGV